MRKKKSARPGGADRFKKKAFNAWLSILELIDFITDGPSFLTSAIVSLLTTLIVLWLTGRL